MNQPVDRRALQALLDGAGRAEPRGAGRPAGSGFPAPTGARASGDHSFWRTYEALTQDYPRVLSQFPERVLLEVVKRYASDCPSRHTDLGRLGARFPTWLSRNKVEAARPDFGDLAALEWAHAECLLEVDARAADAGALAAVPPQKLSRARLRFVPACRLLTLKHSVAGAFEALDGQRRLPPLDARPQALVVWRKDRTVFHAALGADEAKALNVAMRGKPLSRVFAQFRAAGDPTRAAHAAVGSWLTEKMIASVQL